VADRRLHIAIDGRELLGHVTGVGRYLWHMLDEWTVRMPVAHRLTVVLPSAPSAEHRDAFPGLEWHVDEHAGSSGTLWEQTRLPLLLRRLRADALYAVGYTAPLWRVCPFVVLTHDVSFIAHPEWFGRREGLRRTWLTRLSARRAHTVLTVSEFSAAEITRLIGIPRARMQLASPGAPPRAVPTGPGARPPMVLYVGSIFNRRNVPLLVEAFSLVVSRVPTARLLLVGDNRTEPRIDLLQLIGAKGLSGVVEWREYVSDPELEQLYGTARVFGFLSEYEGFAMTPMEAIARGVAAVMLRTPVAEEIYGDGAWLVPAEVTTIADTLTTLLTDADAHRAALERGLQRLGRYSWSASAAVTMQALERAARP
jgi:glycosyltransferase involved in cell wall biosynthesis